MDFNKKAQIPRKKIFLKKKQNKKQQLLLLAFLFYDRNKMYLLILENISL